MDSLFFLRPVLALVFVCSLIGLVALLAKKFRLEERLTSRIHGNTKKQLAMIETLVVDSRRKLILIKRDNTGHLLLLGPEGDVVVETGIPLHSDVVLLSGRLQSQEAKESYVSKAI